MQWRGHPEAEQGGDQQPCVQLSLLAEGACEVAVGDLDDEVAIGSAKREATCV